MYLLRNEDLGSLALNIQGCRFIGFLGLDEVRVVRLPA